MGGCKQCDFVTQFGESRVLHSKGLDFGVFGYGLMCMTMKRNEDNEYFLELWEDFTDKDTSNLVRIHNCPFCGRKLDG